MIIAFLGGLVTFSAFGAAILAFLAGSNVLDNVAQFWVDHATSEIIRRRRAAPTEEQRKGVVSGVLSGSVAVIQFLSGAGMIGCGLWLLSEAENWKHPVLIEICYWTGVSSFIADAVLITVLTGMAVLLVGILPLFSKTGPGSGQTAKPVG